MWSCLQEREISMNGAEFSAAKTKKYTELEGDDEKFEEYISEGPKGLLYNYCKETESGKAPRRAKRTSVQVQEGAEMAVDEQMPVWLRST